MNTVPAKTATTIATTTAAAIIAAVRCLVTRACRRANDLVGSELMPGAVVTTRPPPSLSPKRNACLPANGIVATRAKPSHVPPEELRSSIDPAPVGGLDPGVVSGDRGFAEHKVVVGLAPNGQRRSHRQDASLATCLDDQLLWGGGLRSSVGAAPPGVRTPPGRIRSAGSAGCWPTDQRDEAEGCTLPISAR